MGTEVLTARCNCLSMPTRSSPKSTRCTLSMSVTSQFKSDEGPTGVCGDEERKTPKLKPTNFKHCAKKKSKFKHISFVILLTADVVRAKKHMTDAAKKWKFNYSEWRKRKFCKNDWKRVAMKANRLKTDQPAQLCEHEAEYTNVYLLRGKRETSIKAVMNRL